MQSLRYLDSELSGLDRHEEGAATQAAGFPQGEELTATSPPADAVLYEGGGVDTEWSSGHRRGHYDHKGEAATDVVIEAVRVQPDGIVSGARVSRTPSPRQRTHHNTWFQPMKELKPTFSLVPRPLTSSAASRFAKLDVQSNSFNTHTH